MTLGANRWILKQKYFRLPVIWYLEFLRIPLPPLALCRWDLRSAGGKWPYRTVMFWAELRSPQIYVETLTYSTKHVTLLAERAFKGMIKSK